MGHSNYYPQKSDVEIQKERVLTRDKIIEELETKLLKKSRAKKIISKSKKKA